MRSTSIPAPSRAAAAISRADFDQAGQLWSAYPARSGSSLIAVKPSSAASRELLKTCSSSVALEREQEVQPDLVAVLATEQVPDRGAVVLALDVPQRDVDRRQRAGQDVAAERAHPVQRLLDVVDLERVLADQVLAELVDDGVCRIGETPRTGLADPGQSGVGRDPDDEIRPDQIAPDEESLDLLDLHAAALSSRRRRADGPAEPCRKPF